jgi:23S rRNA (uracil1939-C5)-methyltransferase
MVHGGLCLSKLEDGATLFVEGGIPGEDVEVELLYAKKKVWFGRTRKVLSPSPDRVEAPCPYFGECGGCQLQHVAYARQLKLKEEIVRDAFERQHVDAPAFGLHGMDDPWRYRWRGEFHVIPGKDGMHDAQLGFNRQRSWRPIAVDDCLIHHHTITDAIKPVCDLIAAGARPDLSTVHLTVGDGGKELLINPRPKDAIDPAAIDVAARSGAVNWSTTETSLSWRGRSFRVTPQSFIQVNQGHLDTLYSLVLDAVGGFELIVDAYAGVGMLATILAEQAQTVICIENNPGAVAMGRLNAELNGVSDRIEWICDGVESALAGAVCGMACDAVVLDPPRAGCENSVTAFLALAGPPKLVYVSCEPSTLARDLRVLCTSGPYRIKSVDLVDMFAQTHHIETVVVMDRQEPVI